MSKFQSVTLSTPLTIDGHTVSMVKVRKPAPGELRGVRLTLLMALDVDALNAVLPRITEPLLPEDVLAKMELEDYTALGTAVVGFMTGGPGLTM